MKVDRRSCALVSLLVLWSGMTLSGRPEAQTEKSPNAGFQRIDQLERRLTDYLNGRVLVFRKAGLEGARLEFDRSGRPKGSLSEREDRRAIRFLELRILEGRMVLRAEEVWPEIRDGKRIYVRRGEVIPVVRSITELPEDPTFLSVISLLARIFLTAGELDEPGW